MRPKFSIWCLILHVQTLFLIVSNAKNIKGPPIIKEHPKSIVARRNSPVTLNCAVSGAQDIRWFRDGQRVVSTRQNAHSHRMVLPDGSLFFLRVTANERDGDAGVYWCVASNRRGKAKSHSATLSIAFLDEFARSQRQDRAVVAVVGHKAVLRCRPPNGLPKPRVRWKHRGATVEYDDRIYPNADGDLIFDGVDSSDAGTYVCEASNLASSQKSDAINLQLTEPHSLPNSISKTVNIHENAVLPCNSQHGDHSFNVTWKKRGGKIPIDRSQIVKQSLQISNAAFSDSGEYFCESVDQMGNKVAVVSLKVYQKPVLLHRSADQLVPVEASFNVSCNITGNPSPLVIWKVSPARGPTTYLLPGHANSAITTVNASQLSVTSANRNDTGTYSCWGINSSSSVAATSSVTVLETFPPPLMGTKPQNLGRREGWMATFPCEASSEFLPSNITWWYRNDINPTDVKVQPRDFVSILPIGALVIRNVSASDAGIYTCMVASTAGSVKEEAVLVVNNEVIGSHPTRYVATPAPPSKPIAVSVTDSSIHISWKPNSKRVPKEDVKYSIEMWTSPWSKWKVVTSGLVEESFQVVGLRANQPYVFVVRATSQYGSESFPSPWSDVISTSSGEVVDIDQEKYLRRKLSKVHVTLLGAEEISPGTVDLSWEVRGEVEKHINTFAVYLIQDSVVNRFIVFGSSSSYRLTDLRPDSSLTIFIAPIIGSQEGTPSNFIRVKIGYTIDFHVTPHNIKATNFASGYLITWENPIISQDHIIGYKVLVMSNGSTTYYNTNETSIKFNPRSSSFSVKVAVVADTGPGAWSEPKTFRGEPCCFEGETMPSVLCSPFHPAWFLYLLIPTALFVVLLSLLYLRYIRQKSAPPATAQLASPVYYSDSSSFGARTVANNYGDKKLAPHPHGPEIGSIRAAKAGTCGPIVAEYAEPRWRYDDAEPYATTALLAPPPPIHVTSHCGDSGDYVPENNLRVNWSTLLPPPPQEPPPVEQILWEGHREVGGCDHCCQHESHIYQHPCNAMPSTRTQYIVPYSQFQRFTSLQTPKRPEAFIMETKSSTH